ncbi:S8 family peptidase [Litoribacillus peritrichatus]|uniref:PKD domain-containing protein n=1 Tax=Litoribacillus peritrichatus TaxID=718191 RepID=A0ABP7MMB9_9GAMM
MDWRLSLRALICGTLVSSASYGAVVDNNNTKQVSPNAKNELPKLLVRWEDNVVRSSRVRPSGVSIKKTFNHIKNVEVVEVQAGKTLKEALSEYEKIPGVAVVEPDYRVHSMLTPSDLDFGLLWGLDNASNTDINAPQAWDLTTGSPEVVVAVIDSGVDYTHDDLKANMWQNPNEVPDNGIDDDNNGYIDDVYGIDAANDDSDPMDDDNHGTHVSGTIAAALNNGKGVVGVAPNTKIIACKFLDSFGGGDTSDAIECLNYLYDLKVNHGVNIVATNNSWGGGGYSEILKDVIDQHKDAGMVFVAAAGNETRNIDIDLTYPASFDNENIISVAAIDEQNQIADFSNFGIENVDIAAPGVDIYSTLRDGQYGYMSGTSMAAPHVTGAIALLAAHLPSESADVYQRLVTQMGVRVPGLNGLVAHSQRMILWGENNDGPLNCEDKKVVRVLEPVSPDGVIFVTPNVDLPLKVSVHNCGKPVLDQTFLAKVDGEKRATLVDTGTGADDVAGDGIYHGMLSVDFLGTAVLSFSDESEADSGETTPSEDESNETIVGDIAGEFIINSNYRPSFTEVPYEFIEVEGTPLSLSLDDFEQININFPVKWPWADESEIFVGSNGIITAGAGVKEYHNSPLPYSLVNHGVMPFWDDLDPAGGSVTYSVIGNAPDRQLVVDYKDVQLYEVGSDSPEDRLTFQVVMSERTPEIVFNYKDVDVPSNSELGAGSSATIGYQYQNIASDLSYNSALLSSETSYKVSIGDINIDDFPEISTLSVSGVYRPGYPITLEVVSSAAEENAEIQLSVDFGEGESITVPSETANLSHIYAEAGTYNIEVSATWNDKKIFRTVVVNILELSQFEQELVNSEHQRTLDIVANDPESYGLDSPETLITATKESIDALASGGTYLLGSSEEITDLTAVFANAHLVWTYTDEGGFLGWSPDAAVKTKISNSGYDTLTKIEAGSGFWVKK